MENKVPKRPVELSDEHSRKYWDRHAKKLWQDGTLTARDVEGFILLCQIWGRLQQLSSIPLDAENYRIASQINNLQKQYHQYARAFGLLGYKNRPEKPEQSLTELLGEVMGERSGD